MRRRFGGKVVLGLACIVLFLAGWLLGQQTAATQKTLMPGRASGPSTRPRTKVTSSPSCWIAWSPASWGCSADGGGFDESMSSVCGENNSREKCSPSPLISLESSRSSRTE